MAAAEAGADEVVNMRTMIMGMSDSITTLQNQMAALLEDPGLYNNRCPDSVDIPIESTDLGPAIRERTYARAHHASRSDMQTMAERVNELESNLAFYYSELTTDRDNMNKMDEAISTLQNTTSTSRASVHGAGKWTWCSARY